MERWIKNIIILAFVLVVLSIGLAWAWWNSNTSDSNQYIADWVRDEPETLETLQEHRCTEAPFILPSEGLIGLLWGDTARPYSPLQRHTGIDIFGHGAPGTAPIYAAYDGWLTRLDSWQSSVIIRHDDPLKTGRTIWTYYTHMANTDGSKSFIDRAFPQGTNEKFVTQGTLLGYQGTYNGGRFPIAMHLHFSIVRSDHDGSFTNESMLTNTIDPSPYFELPLRLGVPASRPIRCRNNL